MDNKSDASDVKWKHTEVLELINLCKSDDGSYRIAELYAGVIKKEKFLSITDNAEFYGLFKIVNEGAPKEKSAEKEVQASACVDNNDKYLTSIFKSIQSATNAMISDVSSKGKLSAWESVFSRLQSKLNLTEDDIETVQNHAKKIYVQTAIKLSHKDGNYHEKLTTTCFQEIQDEVLAIYTESLELTTEETQTQDKTDDKKESEENAAMEKEDAPKMANPRP